MLVDTMVGEISDTNLRTEDLASINEIPGEVSAMTFGEGTFQNNSNNTNAPPIQANSSSSSNFPPPKTDKPRPHVCTTCGRSFARLEHLKRHERSHTKEKPFGCPSCTRCFARRDLLLRHQQKLHMATAPSSRSKHGRRESTGTGTGGNRVRKNSAANNNNSNNNNNNNNNNNTVRPRANTTGHVDGSAAMGAANKMTTDPASPASAAAAAAAAANTNTTAMPFNETRHSSIGSAPSASGYDYRGFSAGHPHANHGLSKIETSGLPIDLSGGLRTAPVYGSFDFGLGEMLMDYGSTINPAQLHFAGSPQSLGNDIPASPFSHPIQDVDPMVDEDFNNFDWINGFDPFMVLGSNADSAVEESSPSAMSTGSQSGFSENVIDSSSHLPVSSSSAAWPNSFPGHTAMPSTTTAAQFTMDFSSPGFSNNDVGIPPPETVSPKSLMAQNTFSEAAMYGTPAPMAPLGQSALGGHSQSLFPSSMATSGGSPNHDHYHNDFPFNTPFAPDSAAPPHSFTSTFTDCTRRALQTSISQPTGLNNHRKYSQPSSSNSNMYSNDSFSSRSTGFNSSATHQLPSTMDMRRFISAYVTFFHPHLPFLHIPTLNFQAPGFTSNIRTPNGQLNLSSDGIAGGAGCLILSIAAIGALYEFDEAASKELLEASKKLIQLYLEERRKIDKSVSLGRANSDSGEDSVHSIPLWLVQAMLLNVIYGHASGDKMSADIASTHCAALVSLARAADLTQHVDAKDIPKDHLSSSSSVPDGKVNRNSGSYSGIWSSSTFTFDSGGSSEVPKERRDWLDWKVVEERKRTLYAIFIVSSFLVTTYNYAPALSNSEIQLDLPCEESMWAAESPQVWRKMSGPSSAPKDSLSSALTALLTASQREQQQPSNFSLNPSTFGCLVLILALHNYIWETRQRHMGRKWTPREAEAMQAHIEPALRAWQSAWASNPVHSLERPNPFGAGPLSADCIPLLDLAYIRLFVNLGRSREAFSQRDWNAMADEVAHGTDIFHADKDTSDTAAAAQSSSFKQVGRHNSVSDLGGVADLSITPSQDDAVDDDNLPTVYQPNQSARESQLQKAAFYAADSMAMSDRLGNTLTEFSAREMPIQCAICTFDCGQILAEWICTVQERVGPYLGILGRDEIDLTVVPAIMLLEDEDRKLVEKIKEILDNFEAKLQRGVQNDCPIPTNDVLRRLSSSIDGGFASKIAVTTACLLEQASVWSVTHLMVQSLEAQAVRMKERAEKSVIMRNL